MTMTIEEWRDVFDNSPVGTRIELSGFVVNYFSYELRPDEVWHLMKEDVEYEGLCDMEDEANFLYDIQRYGDGNIGVVPPYTSVDILLEVT